MFCQAKERTNGTIGFMENTPKAINHGRSLNVFNAIMYPINFEQFAFHIFRIK